MSMRFSHHRIHVGFRLSDWSDVWYEPFKHGETGEYEDDEEDEPMILLFKRPKGEPEVREPMSGEVAWHPFFDPRRFESDVTRQKQTLQKRCLSDLHKYFREQDPERVRELEEELGQIGGPRWKVCLEMAIKDKRARLQRRESGRRRAEAARNAGLSEQQIEELFNYTDDDSAFYDSDEDTVRKEMNAATSLRSAKSRGKRKETSKKRRGRGQQAKRPRPSSNDIFSQRTSPWRRLGSSTNSVRTTRETSASPPNASRPATVHLEDDADEESDFDWSMSADMDTRDPHKDMPPPVRPSPFGGPPSWIARNSGGYPTPSASQRRVRGRSVTDSIRSGQSGRGNARNGGDGGDRSGIGEAGHDGGLSTNRNLAPDSDQSGWVDVRGHNGDNLNEDEAVNAAMRASQPPE